MSLGPAEILVVLVLALFVFGPKRLPEVGRQVGGALRELRKVQDTVQHEIRSVLDDTTAPVREMHPNTLLSNREPRAIEPDLGDEHSRPAVAEAPAPEPSAPEPRAPEPRAAEQPGVDGPDIDRLSGGTFS
jgi:sec-independent protein translocase protein TatA